MKSERNKISKLEMMRIRRRQDEEYQARHSHPLHVGEGQDKQEYLTGKMESEEDYNREIAFYESIRTNPESFEDRKIVKPDIDGNLKEGTVNATDLAGNWLQKNTYDRVLLDTHSKAVEKKEKTFINSATDERVKYLSGKMERIFAYLIYKIFPGFEVNIPAKNDDLFNGTDLTLFKREGEKIKTVFSFDMFFQNEAGNDKYWMKKILNNTERLLNGNFSYVNYINSGDLFFSGENCPGFILPISKESLLTLMDEYSKHGDKENFLYKIKNELRYCIFLQIELFKKLILKLPENGKKDTKQKNKILKIITNVEKSLGRKEKKPESYEDKTLQSVCEFLENRIKKPDSFYESLTMYQTTKNLKKGYAELENYENMPDKEKSEYINKNYGSQKRLNKNRKAKNFWDGVKRVMGL